MTEKKELRKRCIERMNALPQDYCREADEKIFSEILALPEYRSARTVFCFVGMQAEIRTAVLIEEMLRAGKQVAVPRCAGKGIMHAHVIRSLAELRPGTMGILEPSAEAPVVAPAALDLILLPCVSANRSGARLGYGGGFYDRYLPKSPAFRALLIRERMLSDEIPLEPHDQRVDALITEIAVFRIGNQSEKEGVS